MNFKTLRNLFHQLARDAVRLGPHGVLALPNTGTTQSHARELAETKLLGIAEENRPTNVVFWHRQSHARAFDAGGELVRPLYLHWSGERAHIASALASLLRGADVRLVPATRDEAAFVIEPLSIATDASIPEATPPRPDALRLAKRPTKRAPTEGSAPASPARFQISRLKDTPETEAMLVDAVRTHDGASALDALQVLLRFGQAREEKLIARHRKAGTLDAFYAELAGKPGPYPPAAIDALVTNAARVADAVSEGRESAFLVALTQARRGAHPALPALLAASAAASPWRARRAVALQCESDTVGGEVVTPWLEALVSDAEVTVASQAIRSLASLRGVSLATHWLDALDAGRLAERVRRHALRDLAFSTLDDAERVRARHYAKDPDLSVEDVEAFQRATA